MRRFPGIGFRGDGPDRRAWLTGTGLEVWETVMLLRIGHSDRQLVDDYRHLTQASLDLARAYNFFKAASSTRSGTRRSGSTRRPTSRRAPCGRPAGS
jgi:hypothetical protein